MSEPVVITRLFDASPETLWQAWTDPDIIAQWFKADPTFSLTVLELNPQPNGHFRFAFSDSHGQPIPGEYTGIYLTIEPPHHLAFHVEDFTLTGDPQDSTATFDIQLEPTKQQTKLTLTATHLPASSENMTIRDWNKCFNNLAQTLKIKSEVTN